MNNCMKAQAIKDLRYSLYLKILSNCTHLKARANFERIFKYYSYTLNPQLYSHSYDHQMILIYQEIPERTMIYNRRAPSAGPMHYADDSLEAELNMGRDIKIQTEAENDSSSVASNELVFDHSVYLLER